MKQLAEHTEKELLSKILDALNGLAGAQAKEEYIGQWRVLSTIRLPTIGVSRQLVEANRARKKIRIITITPAANVDINHSSDVRAGNGWRITSTSAPYEDASPFCHGGEFWAISDAANTDIIVAEWV